MEEVDEGGFLEGGEVCRGGAVDVVGEMLGMGEEEGGELVGDGPVGGQDLGGESVLEDVALLEQFGQISHLVVILLYYNKLYKTTSYIA